MREAEHRIYCLNESLIRLEKENKDLKGEVETLTVIIKGILKATMGFTIPIEKRSV